VLCRRAMSGYGRWFPGGYVDRARSSRTPRPRSREECGLEVVLEGLVSLHSYRGKTPSSSLAARRGGELKVGRRGKSGVRAFAAETIPWDDLAFESTGRR